MKILAPTEEGIASAAAAVRAGQVVAYPTETVYGLAVDPFSSEALDRLFQAKGRDPGNPVLLIISDASQLTKVAATVSEKAMACIEAFWPGPLSLLFPKQDELPGALTAGSDKVCVRCPASGIARALCRAAGSPITSSSANRSGMPPARGLAELDLPGIAFALDGGALGDSPPSTVYDPDTGQILREGAIPAQAIRQALEM